MDQQQFKIGMSVSTKLLITITLLLATPIFFINVSAIRLFRADKITYIYDTQATTALLAGREFAGYLESGLSTLKLIVGTVDISRPLSESAKSTMRFYLDNQHSLLGTELYALEMSTQLLTPVHQQFLPEVLKSLGSKTETLRVDPAKISAELSTIMARGYAFVNISKPELPPLLAIMFSDIAHTSNRGIAPVVIGYVSLAHFRTGAGALNRFIIADRTGTVLFHSDERALYQNMNVAQDAIFSEALVSSVNSAAKEYLSTRGVRTLGSYYKPGMDLYVLSQIDYDEAMKAAYTLTEKFMVLGLASLGLMIVLGLLFSRRLTAPLNRLFEATTQVATGDFKINLPITSRDEIGALTTSFVTMSHKISDLIQSTADKVRVDQDLEIAKMVQQSLFPPPKIENEQLLFCSRYQSAAECGGDWLGYFRNGDRHVVIIADATGHGLSSALMTAAARSCFSVIEKLAESSLFSLDPAEMLKACNRVVFDSAQGKIMMTAFVGVLDFKSHTLTYSSAAHNPVWLFRKTEEALPKQISLIAPGRRLGEVRDIEGTYEVKKFEFKKDDLLLLYTDGLIDGKNQAGQQYGKKQARGVIEDAFSHDPQTIIINLLSDFLGHNSGKKLDDDVTLGAMRILI